MFIIFLSFPFDNDFFKTKQAGLSSCLPLLRRCMQTFLSLMAMSAAGTAGTAVAALLSVYAVTSSFLATFLLSL